MNNKEHLNQINFLIKELENILTEETIENLSQLEIDLSLDKMKRMYNTLLKMKTGSEIDKSNLAKQEVDQIEKPETKDSTEEIGDYIHSTEVVSEETEIKNEEIIALEEKEPPMEFPAEDKTEEKAEKSEEEITEEIKAGDVLDLFDEPSANKNPEPSEKVNEIQEGSEKETVADKLHKNKLVTIKSAIGINEKFFFLNELFAGDLQVYNDNIELLDSKDSFEEARSSFDELSEKFQWSEELEAYTQLLQMIENKFN